MSLEMILAIDVNESDELYFYGRFGEMTDAARGFEMGSTPFHVIFI